MKEKNMKNQKETKKITFLGPIGATFSHDAYDMLAKTYDAPEVRIENYVPAAANTEVLELIKKHGGYGSLAMETLAEGRVAEPLESFIELLKVYGNVSDCPFRVVGAVRMKLHFCLMKKPSTAKNVITKIIAHPKALGACRNRIVAMTNPAPVTYNANSNGEATRLVSEDPAYADFAALGPRSASEKYGLEVIDRNFEDGEAITTFFLIAPKEHPVVVGKENRILIVFKVPHKPGALVKSLQPFEQEGLNLIQIHSVHAGNLNYNFAIEIEVRGNELRRLEKAMRKFEEHVDTHISFGPFEVISK